MFDSENKILSNVVVIKMALTEIPADTTVREIQAKQVEDSRNNKFRKVKITRVNR